MYFSQTTTRARTPFTAAKSYLLSAILLATAGCDGAVAPAASKDAKQAIPAPAGAASVGACDVSLTAGSDAPSIELQEGKTYCLGDLKLTRATSLAAARASLGGGCREEVLLGETRLQCRGVELSFAGPILILSAIRTTSP